MEELDDLPVCPHCGEDMIRDSRILSDENAPHPGKHFRCPNFECQYRTIFKQLEKLDGRTR